MMNIRAVRVGLTVQCSPVACSRLIHRSTAKLSRALLAFGSLLLFIAAVSVHDAALVVLNHDVMIDFEKNPLGTWLIAINGGSVWLFVVTKLFGTAVACTLAVSVYEWSHRIGLAVAGPVAVFQAALLLYLSAY